MKINDLLKEDYNQSGTSSVITEEDGATTSDAVAKILKPVSNKKGDGPEIIKRTSFIDYAIGDNRTTCPACDFIKKNNIGYSSKVKCFLCDKEFNVSPKHKKD